VVSINWKELFPPSVEAAKAHGTNPRMATSDRFLMVISYIPT
jgi:hypothetical protein